MSATGSPGPSGHRTVPVADDDSEEDQNDQPLPMTASVVLSALPKNTSEALQGAGDLPQAKVTIRFQAVGSAQSLRQAAYKVSSTHRFSYVVSMLRKKLGLQPRDSVFCYVNSVFSPGLDEIVGNLWRVRLLEHEVPTELTGPQCFKNETRQELVINYAMTPAFG